VPAPFPLLLLDTGSPVVSLAVARLAREGLAVATRAIEQQRSSASLLDLVREALNEAGIAVRDLAGIAALRGPGSFTGLRIGLATALGLHQVLGVPATALPSLQALAAVPEVDGVVVAAVDALRGEWCAQAFASGPVPRPLGEMELVPGAALPSLAGGRPAAVVGFGVSRLADLRGRTRLVEPGPLASVAVRLAAAPTIVWRPDLLVSPIYSRPPAISAPRPRHAAPASRES
jgi:tRNA threonylcarbamoyladenosine biosynthesis protein TsaB